LSLEDWQRGFGQMVSDGASRGLNDDMVTLVHPGLCLTDKELNWLQICATTAGFEVTCTIQRRWRRLRLLKSCKLTVALLGRERSEKMIELFTNYQPLRSMYFITEAIEFLQFVAKYVNNNPHERTVVKFERALLMASDARAIENWNSASDGIKSLVLQKNPASAVVLFPCSPEVFISALHFGTEFPAYIHDWPVLVAPGLPELWRPATDEEVTILSYTSVSSTKLDQQAVSERSVYDLMLAGALISNKTALPKKMKAKGRQ
jgi:hypothetical protein